MGLFHDTCVALVDAATGRALSGETLKEAERLLAAVDSDGRATRLSGVEKVRVLAAHGWAECGHSVPKRAKICSKCGSRAPKGWIKCSSCGKWVGNESQYCPNCNHPMHPLERIDLAGGVWDRAPGVFAQRFECGDLSHLKRSGLYVQEGSVAVLLDAGKQVSVLGPGRHTPESLARSINWFGNPPPRSVVMVDSGDIIVRLDFPPPSGDGSAIRSAEEKPIRVTAEATLHFVPSLSDDFLKNVMKDSRALDVGEIVELLYDAALPAVRDLCAQTTVEDLVKDPRRRERIEDAILQSARPVLKRAGLELIRIGSVDFLSPEYEEMRERYAELDQSRRIVEYNKKVLDLLAEDQSDRLDSEARMGARQDEATKEAAQRRHELGEFLAQLTQEEKLSGKERETALQLADLVAKGQIDRKQAELEAASRLEQHAKELENQAHTLKLELNLKEFNREQALADAQNRAAVNAVARAEREKDAHSDTVLAGEQLEQEKIKAEISQIQSDAQLHHLQNLQKIQEQRDVHEQEMLEKKAKTLSGRTPLEMMALAQTQEERQMYLQMALNQQSIEYQQSLASAEKAMTPEQLLARAAATSPAAAAALAQMATAGNGAADRVLQEMKEMAKDRTAHDDKMMDKVAEIVNEAVKHQNTTVVQPNQIFNK